MKGSQGAEMADGLVIKEEDYKLVKTRFSSFFATNLDSVLKTSGQARPDGRATGSAEQAPNLEGPQIQDQQPIRSINILVCVIGSN